jgi:hypothetical protein
LLSNHIWALLIIVRQCSNKLCASKIHFGSVMMSLFRGLILKNGLDVTHWSDFALPVFLILAYKSIQFTKVFVLQIHKSARWWCAQAMM